MSRSLPRIDEQIIDVDADLPVTWSSLIEALEKAQASKSRELVARRLACDPAQRNGASLQTVGATLPGFRVATVEPLMRVELVGEHRWARYSLDYRLEELMTGETRLCAATRAQFLGRSGSIYRMLVIGTRLHVVAVRATLQSIKGHAESRGVSDLSSVAT
jgi:hypothetical protein